MILETISWTPLGVVIAAIALVGAVVGWIVRATLGRTLDAISKRLDGHDSDIGRIEATTTSTRVAIARIEGYMSKGNGGGERLPATELSTQLARHLTTEPAPESVYELEDGAEFGDKIQPREQ